MAPCDVSTDTEPFIHWPICIETPNLIGCCNIPALCGGFTAPNKFYFIVWWDIVCDTSATRISELQRISANWNLKHCLVDYILHRISFIIWTDKADGALNFRHWWVEVEFFIVRRDWSVIQTSVLFVLSRLILIFRRAWRALMEVLFPRQAWEISRLSTTRRWTTVRPLSHQRIMYTNRTLSKWQEHLTPLSAIRLVRVRRHWKFLIKKFTSWRRLSRR